MTTITIERWNGKGFTSIMFQGDHRSRLVESLLLFLGGDNRLSRSPSNVVVYVQDRKVYIEQRLADWLSAGLEHPYCLSDNAQARAIKARMKLAG